MFKKSIASIVTAAFLVAGPGNLSLTAAAQTVGRAPVTGVSITPSIGAGLNSPAASFNAPVLTPGAMLAPSLLSAPTLAPVAAPIAVPAASGPSGVGPISAKAAVAAMPAAIASPLAVIKSQDASIPVAAKAAALDTVFDNSVRTGAESLEVMGQLSAPSVSELNRADVVAAKAEKAKAGGSILLGVTVGFGAVAVAAAVSSPFRNLLKRVWNVTLGRFGMLVKIGETPEVLAERIIQQLDAARPVYNQKVADASTLVEKLKQQIQHETDKVAELEQGITALLSDSDPTNDIQASGMINQQKSLNASIASTKEQLVLGETGLANIKHSREVFFAEREETLSKISSQLNTLKAARINEQIAKLKGDFELGGLKDNLDKLDQAVDDAVAKSKGTVDSVESNPDQILKKAKDSLKSQEVQDEIAKRKAAIEKAKQDKGKTGGLLLEIGLGASVIAIAAAISKPFRNLLIRLWNVTLGRLGMLIKSAETPEVLAQRIIDQLNEQKPIYNRKVQEASTLVESLRLQIEKQEKQSAELDRSVTAILSDSDPLNDVMAESLLNQKKTVDSSTAKTKEQVAIAEKGLESIKAERVRFFSEREEMLAKISERLNTLKAAKINEEIAKLKGDFEIGGLKDNLDKLDQAVDDAVAKSKGTVDSVESNPDQILKKAKESLKNQEVQDEIAKRKAAIEKAKQDKGKAGGDASQSKALGLFAKAIGIGFALISPWIASAVFALLGLVSIAMSPEQGKWFGRQLAVIGVGTLVVGAGATFLAAKFGLAVGAFGVGLSFIVPAGIALAAGIIAAVRARGKVAAAVAAAAATPAGSSVMTATVPAGSSTPATPEKKKGPSLKETAGKAWDAALGKAGEAVSKLETPEVLAQRLIDQLNDAKLEYNKQVRDSSALVYKIKSQISTEEAKIADFNKTIDALLTDNDPSNDIQAAGLLNSVKILEASIGDTRAQLVSAEKSLNHMQQERATFFAERQTAINHLLAGMNSASAGQFSAKVASLKTAYEIGDIADNTRRFDEVVAEKSAPSVAASPEELLKQAKDSLRTNDINEELAARKAALEKAKADKGKTGGSILLGVGIGAGVIALVAAISKPFRSLLARVWNITLGRFGMLIKSAETPEVLAERIIQQLNEQKPIYNRKVQEASTLVESLRLQIEKQEKQSAELDRSVTAILSDSDPLNDVMAESLLNQKKTVDSSTAKSKEQVTIAESGLASIKKERERFFGEREEMLAKISERLNTLKAAKINEEIAKLKGDFEIGGLKDNLDKLDQAVDDAVAKSKGTVDSVESNPDQILKKAKESLKNSEVQDEIAKRKAAIEKAKADKGQAGGAVNDDASMTANQAEAGILSKTYSWMTLGLGITAAAAQAAIITGAASALAASLPLLIGVIVAQFALVIGLSLAINKLSPGVALGGFLLYSALNGLFLAPVVAMFTVGSVAASFLVTSGMFGAMALIGHTTKKNLNSIGSYGMMALTGIILASIANMFLHSTGLGALLTYGTIVVFVGLTAYDAQKIKEMAQQQGRLTKDDQSRIAVMGALTLYLDFINLFLQILKLMGKAKSKD